MSGEVTEAEIQRFLDRADDEARVAMELTDTIDAEMNAVDPKWKPLDERTKAMITAVVEKAPPMSDAQARRIAQLFRGRSDYRTYK